MEAGKGAIILFSYHSDAQKVAIDRTLLQKRLVGVGSINAMGAFTYLAIMPVKFYLFPDTYYSTDGLHRAHESACA